MVNKGKDSLKEGRYNINLPINIFVIFFFLIFYLTRC
jgi:hypothetical protein